MFRGLQERYQQYHHVIYTPEAIRTAVTLADRYIPARFFPDKAIDVIDEAGAKSYIQTSSHLPDFSAIEKQIEEINGQKLDAASQQNFELAASCRDQEKQLRSKIEEMTLEWKSKSEAKFVEVTPDDVRAVVAGITGIPLTRLEEKEAVKLLKMEENLMEKLIGQDVAIRTIGRALRRSRADLNDPRRPVGSFLFLGPSGVGKTYLAKMLSIFLFGDQDALIRIDMSEYMEKFSVSRLTGSPPGYVGYEEGGQLTEKVRRRPYSVVLFDELEKASPEVINILLQVLEEGQLTDGLGRCVNFRNTIVIMTSNVGIENGGKTALLGFSNSTSQTDAATQEKMKSDILERAKKFFRPEFLNRLDELVVFERLDRESIRKIVTLEVEKLAERLRQKECNLTIAEAAVDFLVTRSYNPEYGAREVRRTVERCIEDPLAEEVLKLAAHEQPSSIQVTISADGSELCFQSVAALHP